MTNDDTDLIGGTRALHQNPLYMLLYKGLPKFRSKKNADRLDCRKLSKSLGISYQALYKWFARPAVPPKKLNALIALPGSKLTIDDLMPFFAE